MLAVPKYGKSYSKLYPYLMNDICNYVYNPNKS